MTAIEKLIRETYPNAVSVKILVDSNRIRLQVTESCSPAPRLCKPLFTIPTPTKTIIGYVWQHIQGQYDRIYFGKLGSPCDYYIMPHDGGYVATSGTWWGGVRPTVDEAVETLLERVRKDDT